MSWALAQAGFAGPVGHLELPEDVRDVVLHRLQTEEELGGDLRVAAVLHASARGNQVVLDMYPARVLWHEGREREVLVLQAEGGPLVGKELLYGTGSS